MKVQLLTLKKEKRETPERSADGNGWQKRLTFSAAIR